MTKRPFIFNSFKNFLNSGHTKYLNNKIRLCFVDLGYFLFSTNLKENVPEKNRNEN